MAYSLDSSIGQVYKHSAGKDAIDKILMQLDLPDKVVTNPVVRNLRLGALKYISFGKVDLAFLMNLVDLLNTHPQSAEPGLGEPKRDWWKQDVVYQIYPRSFQDSNGDGIGDLPGITSRLDYLKDLGVGALWMSPIFDSPNDDMGYDIRDYRKVMEEFGTLDDFDELVREAHKRGLKVILDLVVNHTSDEHEWFQGALADKDSPYRDYYFFTEGGGTAPNNWDSFFSGPAWRHYPEQDLWALHLFSSKQMDLNWENPKVRKEVADIVRFWTDRGVDGFRLDVINYISKQPELPDGSPVIGEMMGFTGIERYFYGPKLHQHLAELNREAFAERDIFTVGETPGIGLEVGKLLTDPARAELDLTFIFDHLETPGHVRQDDYRYDLNFLKKYYMEALGEFRGQYWMSLFFENHDNPRMSSKVNPDPQHRAALSKLLGGILLTLRGTPFLFQGQELGMVNQEFSAIDELRDVEALNAYEELRQEMSDREAFQKLLAGTRDHARTPMQWDSSDFGGFSTVTPWIEGDGDYAKHSVLAESADPNSVLSFYRALLHWRDQNADFVYADMEFLDGEVPNYWAYRRGEFVVQMNLTELPLELSGDLVSLALVLDADLVQSNLRAAPGGRPDDPANAGRDSVPDPAGGGCDSSQMGVSSEATAMDGRPMRSKLAPYEWRLWRLNS